MFSAAAMVYAVINEHKAELREMELHHDDLDDYDLGWMANSRSTIERLEGIAQELRMMDQ